MPDFMLSISQPYGDVSSIGVCMFGSLQARFAIVSLVSPDLVKCAKKDRDLNGRSRSKLREMIHPEA